MTDRVLNGEELRRKESMLRHQGYLNKPSVAEIIASHRLQAARIQELEKTVGWYEEKHPND